MTRGRENAHALDHGVPSCGRRITKAAPPRKAQEKIYHRNSHPSACVATNQTRHGLEGSDGDERFGRREKSCEPSLMILHYSCEPKSRGGTTDLLFQAARERRLSKCARVCRTAQGWIVAIRKEGER